MFIGLLLLLDFENPIRQYFKYSNGNRILQKVNNEVTSAFASDMMSDCLAFAKDVSVLITGLCNPQVMRTAELLDIECIVFIKGKEPTDSMIQLAKNNGICVLLTDYCMYKTAGLLYETGEIGGTASGC